MARLDVTWSCKSRITVLYNPLHHPFVDDSAVDTAIPVHSQLEQTAIVAVVIVVAGEQTK